MGMAGLLILGALAIVATFVIITIRPEPATVPCGGLTYIGEHVEFQECKEDGTVTFLDSEGNALNMRVTVWPEKTILGSDTIITAAAWSISSEGTIPFDMKCGIANITTGHRYSGVIDQLERVGDNTILVEKLKADTDFSIVCGGGPEAEILTEFTVKVFP